MANQSWSRWSVAAVIISAVTAAAASAGENLPHFNNPVHHLRFDVPQNRLAPSDDHSPNPAGRGFVAQFRRPQVNRQHMPPPGINERFSATPQGSTRLVRLPPVAPAERPRQPIPTPGVASRRPEGTWREEGQQLIVNLNGQEYRLVQSDPHAAANRPASQIQPTGGAVLGRLSNQGRPLVGCEVILVPLKKTWTGYSIAKFEEADLPTAATDGSGVYHFANVPAGLYKLKWRPAGQTGWIRRAEIRPDVRVRTNETMQVKEIRVALRTVN